LLDWGEEAVERDHYWLLLAAAAVFLIAIIVIDRLLQ